MISLIRMGWGQGLPAFRRLYTTLFMPDATNIYAKLRVSGKAARAAAAARLSRSRQPPPVRG